MEGVSEERSEASPEERAVDSPVDSPPALGIPLSLRLYGFLRFGIIIIHNIYHILAYLVITWILLLPLYYLKPKVYWIIENELYGWCLHTVSSWSWLAGMQVIECGDDIYRIDSKTPIVHANGNNNRPPENGGPEQGHRRLDSEGQQEREVEEHPTGTVTQAAIGRKTKIMILANHQSTADVPLMFQALTPKSIYTLLWVMDTQFKYTNFGLVSITHGDYFIKTRGYVKKELTKHCLRFPDKDCIVLFPEGGFRYKRLASSLRYAQNQNLPSLTHVTWPRTGAFFDILQEGIGVTHIADVTILYNDLQNPISIIDIALGRREEPIIFYYRLFDVSKERTLDEKWLNERWLEKEEIMKSFYEDRESFMRKARNIRPVQLSWFKVVNIHLFYLGFTYWCIYFVVNVYWALFSNLKVDALDDYQYDEVL